MLQWLLPCHALREGRFVNDINLTGGRRFVTFYIGAIQKDPITWDDFSRFEKRNVTYDNFL